MTTTAQTETRRVVLAIKGRRVKALLRMVAPSKLASGWGTMIEPNARYSTDNGKTWNWIRVA